MAPASGGSFSSALPAPGPAIFGAGQPMLMSIISAPEMSSARFAPSAMDSGSWPKICAETGRPPSGTCSSAAVFLSL